jgi:hypothetical protein
MAVLFQKINGFPVDLLIETEEYEDKDPDGTPFKGFVSKIYLGKDANDKNLIKEFYHSQWRDRIHFADGFFTALRLNENKKI